VAFNLHLAPAMRDGQQTASRRASSTPGISPLALGLILAAILCAAALLRFYRLDHQSFWNDEGNSARIAERSLGLILEGAAGDVHPPGYYLLLHAWRRLFGQSEFALRSLSVVAGLGLVSCTWLLGRHLSGRAVGLIAASLSALSPFAVYYSQEARMYALLGALAAAATYVTHRTLEDLGQGAREGRRGSQMLQLVAYALVNAAGLYTHYTFVFVLIAHNVAFLLRWLVGWARSRARCRGLVWWAGAQVGCGLLYLPWLPTALNAAGWSPARGDPKAGSALLDVARVLTVGETQPLGAGSVAVAVTLGLMVVGLWSRSEGRRKRRGAWAVWWGTASLAIYLVVPLGLFFAFDLYKPAWLKFLILLLAPYHVFVARGVGTVAALASRTGALTLSHQRIVRPVVCGVLVATLAVLMYPSLRNLYFDPAYARDDYRQLAADIRGMRRPGDAIVLNAPNQWEVFTYYYPDRDVYPAPYRPGPATVSSFLDPLLDEYQRLFVLYWGDAESDPERRVEAWLAEHAYKSGDRWYGDVRLATYGVGPLPREPSVSLDVLFGEGMALEGSALLDDTFVPGEIVPVTLFWEALRDVETWYKVSVQMLDGEGHLVSQVDTVPGDGLWPTTSWRAGDSLIDRYGVRVPSKAPSGSYSLIVVVYDAADGRRLSVERPTERVGDAFTLGEIVVDRSQ
jgi:4-amino-4-deoxy-L-arabinose transferase-like glycosyltransferase